MPRYKAVVEYNGTDFAGWQSQPNGNTVQQIIEKSFLEIQLNKTKIFGSGRTDAGVHAVGQVFHFDYDIELDLNKTLLGLNHFLREKRVSILSLIQTQENFDSRRDAKIRTYNYPQGRVTDHRINLTLYDLQNIVNGDIEKLIDELKVAQNTELMKNENENL